MKSQTSNPTKTENRSVSDSRPHNHEEFTSTSHQAVHTTQSQPPQADLGDAEWNEQIIDALF